jgi:hypothetical protein
MFSNANISADLVTAIDKSYPDLVLRKHFLLGISEHVKGGGASVTLPVSTAYTTSEGTGMASTVTTSSSTARKAFVITPYTLYRTSQVNIADAMWSADPDHAAVDIMLDEAKKTMQGIGDSVERAIFGSGYGAIATISSHTGTTGAGTLTLTRATDAYRFQIGDVLVSKATAAAGSLDSGTVSVTGVNPTTGVLTVLSDGTWSATDTHVLGKSNVMAASTSPVVWPGLGGWNPDVDNAVGVSDSFFGVNRYGIVGAAGTAIDCSGQSVRQALNTLLQTMSFVDGINIDVAFLSPVDYGKLLDDLASSKQFVEVTGEMGVNYDGVKFEGPTGPINVISAPFATAGILRVADSSVFRVKFPGKKPVDLKDDNGAGYIASVTDDVALFTMRANFIWYPTNPAALGNAKLY